MKASPPCRPFCTRAAMKRRPSGTMISSSIPVRTISVSPCINMRESRKSIMIRNDTAVRVDQYELAATVISPDTTIPGVLFLHGWAGSQERDIERANAISSLGCVCLTFDMRGHGDLLSGNNIVTRGENLDDAIAAYDSLASL